MRVLVLSALSSVLEDELTKQAHEGGGDAPVVCMPEAAAAKRWEAAGGQLPYKVVTVRSFRDFDEIGRMAAGVRFDTVATTFEGATQAAAFIRDQLGLPGMRLGTAVAATDKHVMKQTLATAGLPVAAHRVVHSPWQVAAAAHAVGGFPVVLKHRRGVNSNNTYVVRGETDLADLINAGTLTAGEASSASLAAEEVHQGLATIADGFMVEQYVRIDGEFHCEVLISGGNVIYAICGRYSQPCLVENQLGYAGGHLLEQTGDEATAIRDLATKAVNVIGIIDGTAHVEVFRTIDGEWVIGEIGARPGGLGIQPTIAKAFAGIDLAGVLAAQARQEPISINPIARPGVYGWVTALSQQARLESIADENDLRADPRIIHAAIHQAPGHIGEPGSMPIASIQFNVATEDEASALLAAAPRLFHIEWADTSLAGVAA